MGLLDNTTQRDYYQGNDLGNYQFISLQELIAQFEVAYVGKNKIIPKINKLDIQFHAMRALQEFSFDTLKSIKSQQIDIPATLVMPLPHDYVNYTKISSVDSSGIKHLLYPTKDTNNPFQIKQDSDGVYDFTVDSVSGLVKNYDFSSTPITDDWQTITPVNLLTNLYEGGMAIDDGKLKTSYHTKTGASAYQNGRVNTAYQAIDVSDMDFLDIKADGVADTVEFISAINVGTVRVGVSTQIPENNYINNSNNAGIGAEDLRSNNVNASIFDLVTSSEQPSYVEWVGPSTAGSTSATKELLNINVKNVDTVYVVIVMFVDFTVPSGSQHSAKNLGGDGVPMLANSVDNVVLTSSSNYSTLITPVGNEKNSSTWNNYKAQTPSENNNEDYEDNTYWPYDGNRYGLDPSRAQVNGSFYIDPRLGRIHFSSNISGKTVILDYISDSLGTEEEMQVHKLAEEAMYKWIAYAILSTSSLPIHQQLAPRFKKEKFAATRQAKLRLSNIKLEELTQILRGKSKHIKH